MGVLGLCGWDLSQLWRARARERESASESQELVGQLWSLLEWAF